MGVSSTDTIQVDHLRNCYNILNNVLGVTPTGYGIPLSMSLPVYNSVITASTMINLWNDIRKSRWHQTGIDPQPSMPLIAVKNSTQISSAVFNQYTTWCNLIQTDSFKIGSTTQNQASIGNTPVASIRTTLWNTTLTHQILVSFNNVSQARYFFNAGGSIRFDANLTSNVIGIKSNDWKNLLSGMGTICFNYNSAISSNNAGVGTNHGYYDLSTSDTLLYTQTSINYPLNSYTISGKVSSDKSSITFTCTFTDGTTGSTNHNFDEAVTGILTSNVNYLVASGSNVSVLPPNQIETLVELSSTPATHASYVIETTPVSSINDGSTIYANIYTNGVPYNTLINWRIINEAGYPTFASNTFDITSGTSAIDQYGNTQIGPITVLANHQTVSTNYMEFVLSYNGSDVSTSAPIEIVNTSLTMAITGINITPSTSTIGNPFTVTVTTSGIAVGTLLHVGVIPNTGTSSNITNQLSSPAFTNLTVSNSISFQVMPLIDLTGNTTRSFALQISAPSNSQISSVTSQYVTISPLSQSVILIPSATQVTDNNSLSFTLETNNVLSNTTYWYKPIYSTTPVASDANFGLTFPMQISNGTVNGTTNTAIVNFDVPVVAKTGDNTTEYFKLALYSDQACTTQVSITSDISIIYTPPASISYNLVASPTAVLDGGTINWSLTVTNLTVDTIYYWKIIGSGISSSDFTNGNTGSVSVSASTRFAYFSIQVSKNRPVSVALTGTMNLYADSSYTIPLATSNLITLALVIPPTIQILSPTAPVTLISGNTNSAVVVTGITTNIPSGTNIQYTIIPTDVTGKVLTVLTYDSIIANSFQSLTGNVAIDSNLKFTLNLQSAIVTQSNITEYFIVTLSCVGATSQSTPIISISQSQQLNSTTPTISLNANTSIILTELSTNNLPVTVTTTGIGVTDNITISLSGNLINAQNIKSSEPFVGNTLTFLVPNRTIVNNKTSATFTLYGQPDKLTTGVKTLLVQASNSVISSNTLSITLDDASGTQANAPNVTIAVQNNPSATSIDQGIITNLVVTGHNILSTNLPLTWSITGIDISNFENLTSLSGNTITLDSIPNGSSIIALNTALIYATNALSFTISVYSAGNLYSIGSAKFSINNLYKTPTITPSIPNAFIGQTVSYTISFPANSKGGTFYYKQVLSDYVTFDTGIINFITIADNNTGTITGTLKSTIRPLLSIQPCKLELYTDQYFQNKISIDSNNTPLYVNPTPSYSLTPYVSSNVSVGITVNSTTSIISVVPIAYIVSTTGTSNVVTLNSTSKISVGDFYTVTTSLGGLIANVRYEVLTINGNQITLSTDGIASVILSTSTGNSGLCLYLPNYMNTLSKIMFDNKLTGYIDNTVLYSVSSVNSQTFTANILNHANVTLVPGYNGIVTIYDKVIGPVAENASLQFLCTVTTPYPTTVSWQIAN
jgi:hypothetical protein